MWLKNEVSDNVKKLDNTRSIENKRDQIQNFIYKEIMENHSLLTQLVTRWNNELGNIEYEDILSSITNINKCTIEMRLRNFQFRLMWKAIITNVQLKHYKIRTDNLCSRCNQHKETIKHLFVECEKVKSLYLFVATLSNQVIQLDAKSILFDNVVVKPEAAENTIILITKQYVYRCRCMGQKIRTLALSNYIQMYQKIEEQIARNANKLSFHNKKWQTVIFQ